MNSLDLVAGSWSGVRARHFGSWVNSLALDGAPRSYGVGVLTHYPIQGVKTYCAYGFKIELPIDSKADIHAAWRDEVERLFTGVTISMVK